MKKKKIGGKEIGESAFCILYLVFLLITAIIELVNKKYFILLMIIFLGVGDSFHLIPRIKKNLKGDFEKSEFYLGLGNQISSITMTIFYLILIIILDMPYGIKVDFLSVNSVIKVVFDYIIESLKLPASYLLNTIFVYLVAIRIIICLLPQNNWYKKEGNQKWAIIRNIPFVIIGVIAMINLCTFSMYYLAILVTLSFLFYLPVALFAKKNPKLGMLMIPKTFCYMLLIIYFLSNY